ncbi:acyltransferase [Brucella sp. 191011898]|uniref:acyltransferase n=1 Tax=Brucella sp. 191011898 TaxID=2730447 RepID=UPI0015DEACFD|nr:acyltransferase family protein [Brucella sp. 191011898]
MTDTAVAPPPPELSASRIGLGAVERDVGIDAVRIAAAIMVVSVHVTGEYFYNGTHGWGAINIIDSFSRACVPLFFMVSGALLIPRLDKAKKTLDRLIKFLIPLVFWSALYLVWYSETGTLWGYAWNVLPPRLFSISSLQHFLMGPVVFHFWFLYTLIGLYVFLPVLQSFYSKSDETQRYIYLAAWFVGASLLPTIAKLTSIKLIGFDLSYFPLYAGYMLAGAVLSKISTAKRTVIVSFFIYAASSLATAILTVIYSTPAQATELFYSYETVTVLISSLSAFVFLRGCGNILYRISSPSFRSNVVSLTFGVYIIHALVLRYTIDILGLQELNNTYVGIPFLILFVFILSAILSYAVRLLPFGKSLLPA